MRFILTSFALLIATTIWATTDSLNVKRKDSLSEVSITPYHKRDKTALSNYFVSVSSSSLLKFSSGINISNSLRGLYPRLSLPAYAPTAMNYDQAFIIDGVALNGFLNSYMSLNSFDYQGISATQSGNALSILDQATQGGAFILNSKSGKDVSKPTLEFNSYTTKGFGDLRYIDLFSGITVTKKIKDFNFAESIAFSQDFGKVDMRFSYNLNSNHNDFLSDRSYPDTHLNRFKLNMGFDLTPKLNIRLIADASHLKSKYESNSFAGGSREESKRNYYHTNLSINYNILKGLSLSGQFFYGDLLTSNKSESLTSLSTYQLEGGYKLINPTLALQFKRNFGAVSLTSSAGYNYRRSVKDRSSSLDGVPASTKNDLDAQSFFANALIDFKKRIFLDGTWRNTAYSTYPKDQQNKSNYAISTSVLIIKSIAAGSVSNLRLRSSYGESFTNPLFGFPYEWISGTAQLNSAYFTKKEIGADVSFFKERLNISFNYFNAPIKKTYFTFVPFGVNMSTVIEQERTTNNEAFEVIADLKIINSNSVQYTTRLVWANYKSTIDSSNPSFFPSPYPDWVGSVWSMFTWKNLSTLVIVETSQGGKVLDPNPFVTSFNDASWTKLRDVSIGYTFQFPNLKLREWYLSLTGRNLMNSSNQDSDPENNIGGYNVQKSVTLNLGVTF